ncbi:SAV_2336 N-terminal domain-related protein [Streptomyces sp. NPDC006798]|uniref:SAV_2336 N-terminal domain-related protein n=1 Tax=Streptomyces sp. NPDC006798 TaxID=3155462 RepID=UPI0033DBE1E6
MTRSDGPGDGRDEDPREPRERDERDEAQGGGPGTDGVRWHGGVGNTGVAWTPVGPHPSGVNEANEDGDRDRAAEEADDGPFEIGGELYHSAYGRSAGAVLPYDTGEADEGPGWDGLTAPDDRVPGFATFTDDDWAGLLAATDAHGPHEVPEPPQVPEPSEVPEPPQVPEASEVPEPPQVPEASEVPEPPPVPELPYLAAPLVAPPPDFGSSRPPPGPAALSAASEPPRTDRDPEPGAVPPPAPLPGAAPPPPSPSPSPSPPPEPGARIGELLAVLRGAGRKLDAEQALDVLWLARLLPAGGDGAPMAVRAEPSPSAPAVPERPGLGDVKDPAATPEDRLPPGFTPPALYASARQRPVPRAPAEPEPRPAEPRPRPALPVLVPESKALTDQLELGRALRPLRRRRASRDRLEIDVERTVSMLAETRVPDVVQRPVRERWLRLALLVDDGLSMLLWHRLGAELRGLLVRLGAFASLRVHGLDTRARGGPRLRARPFREDSTELPLTGVNDPSGRTLVLVVSDGMGPAWRTGDMHRLLRSWATRGPVAVVHTLPTEMWDASGIHADRWRVTTRATGGANTSWEIADPILPRDLADFDGVPVPVLESTPQSLAQWSRLLVSPGTTVDLSLLARPSRRAPVASAVSLGSAQHFRDAATPEAYRLAAHLAAVAPLSVPVMRLVQEAVPWRAETAHLAEVFLGGLIRPHPAPVPAGEPLPAKHRIFDFTEESKTALLDAVPQAELLLTGRRIGHQLERLAGRSPDFPAWLAHPSGIADLPAGRRPFTHVERRLLSRFGVPLDPSARRLAPPSSRPGDGTGTEGPNAGGGWRPLRPDDPERLGPYRLSGRRRGRRTVVYRGETRTGRKAVLRVPRPDLPAATARLIDAEAEALTRLDGRYAPVLLDRGTEDSTPWLAMTPTRRTTTTPPPGPRSRPGSAIWSTRRPTTARRPSTRCPVSSRPGSSPAPSTSAM